VTKKKKTTKPRQNRCGRRVRIGENQWEQILKTKENNFKGKKGPSPHGKNDGMEVFLEKKERPKKKRPKSSLKHLR